MENRDRRIEIQVGIALILSLIILVAGLLWFQNYRFQASQQIVKVHFSTVGGLGEGDPVHVRGIPMGKVQEIELTRQGVLVFMNLGEGIWLSENARIKVASLGLIGERIINVEPGDGPLIEDLSSHVFEGSYELAISEMMGQLQAFNRRLMVFLDEVQVIVSDLQSNGGLGQALGETTRAARGVADFLETSSSDFSQAGRSLARLSGGIEQFLEEHSQEMGEGMREFRMTAASLDTLVAELTIVAEGAQDLLTAVREQKGSLGRMIYDEEMGEELDASVKSLRFLLQDIQRNPQHYLTVKIF